MDLPDTISESEQASKSCVSLHLHKIQTPKKHTRFRSLLVHKISKPALTLTRACLLTACYSTHRVLQVHEELGGTGKQAHHGYACTHSHTFRMASDSLLTLQVYCLLPFLCQVHTLITYDNLLLLGDAGTGSLGDTILVMLFGACFQRSLGFRV